MLRKILCMDLVAREAWYHNHCRRNYTRKDNRHPILTESEASKMLDSETFTTNIICSYIKDNILAA